MNLTAFTVEEENFICIYDTSSRTALIADIRTVKPHLDVPEICEIADNVLKKLEAMNEDEFYTFVFNPAYLDEERLV